MPRALERRWRMLALCGPACVAFKAPLRHAAPCNSTADALQRSCQQFARPLPSALQPLVEVIVGLAAACDAESDAAHIDAMPSEARRDRPYHCETHVSACRCKNVLWSCSCSAMEMCVGVCTVGARARVLARACVCVLRRGCRTSLLAQETARPFPSCATTGPGLAREGTRHAHGGLRAFFRLFFVFLFFLYNY